jgi:5-methylcytosine-specific restriction endonuclease McrA
MPSLPRAQCDEYQCKAPSVKGSRYCEAHTQSKAPSIDRRAFNAKYKTAAWESIRQRQLSMHPLCAACLIRGQVTAANHVDHVFPWQTIGAHAFTLNLFQSLCVADHGVKSGAEKRGVFIHYTDSEREYTANDYAHAMRNRE